MTSLTVKTVDLSLKEKETMDKKQMLLTHKRDQEWASWREEIEFLLALHKKKGVTQELVQKFPDEAADLLQRFASTVVGELLAREYD